MAGWIWIWYVIFAYYWLEYAQGWKRVTNRVGSFWEIVGSKLKVVQTAAVMEIVHAILGLVHSPVMTTTVQGASFSCAVIAVVFSRVALTWGYANACPDVQESFGVKLMVLRSN